jgi:cytidylate kinase
VIRTNKARANHYWQYTGGSWTDSHNYDLVVNISKVGIDDAADLIYDFIKKKKQV